METSQRALLVSAAAVAQMLGIHRATLFRWIAAGIFPPATLKRGRVVRWSRVTVEQFAQQGGAQ
ncbi:helix-turn-helix transcriptional regulator [Ramlibacter albus]|uniref:Helix-turn-helix domain-containing protein n=1 Tax=Ramlibacter albus TaxID=2079448 RepID=A0A923MD41_9BURK|nr:helix-turn-helix domain-containing protein [Ramlibacter albus]